MSKWRAPLDDPPAGPAYRLRLFDRIVSCAARKKGETPGLRPRVSSSMVVSSLVV